MTPQELIETAQDLNPEKLESRPAEALRDALAYLEALRLCQPKPQMREVPILNPDPPAAAPAKPAGNNGSGMIERLRTYRDENGISVTKLAKQLNINSGTLYFWFAGKYEPGARSLTKIAKFLEAHQ